MKISYSHMKLLHVHTSTRLSIINYEYIELGLIKIVD